MYVCIFSFNFLHDINHSKYLLLLTINRVKKTLGKGLCLSSLTQLVQACWIKWSIWKYLFRIIDYYILYCALCLILDQFIEGIYRACFPWSIGELYILFPNLKVYSGLHNAEGKDYQSNRMEPLYSGHHSFLEMVSTIERCPL